MTFTDLLIAIVLGVAALIGAIVGVNAIRKSRVPQWLNERWAQLGIGAALLSAVVIPMRRGYFVPADVLTFIGSLSGLATMAITGAGVALAARAIWPSAPKGEAPANAATPPAA